MLKTTLRGRYAIIKQLGSGGFGETYLAEDRDFPGNPRCVVKRLQPQSSDPALLKVAKRLFNTEAIVLAKLGKHPQIPQLLAHFQENQEFYLVQEFLEGEDLGKEFASGKRWDEGRAIAFLTHTLPILDFIHQENVIHRDIKPENIIRQAADGKLFLIDFGAVKEITTLAVNQQGQTNFTIAIGTSGYMPNEQQGGKPRFNSDLYALGMVAIQGLTQVHPKSLPENPQTGDVVWRNHVQVSDNLAAILTRMVRSHFSYRYQTAAEVLADLQHFPNTTAPLVPNSTTGARSTAPTVPLPTPNQTQSRSKPRNQLKLTPILLILFIAGAGYTISQLFSRPEVSEIPQPTTSPSIPFPVPENDSNPTPVPENDSNPIPVPENDSNPIPVPENDSNPIPVPENDSSPRSESDRATEFYQQGESYRKGDRHRDAIAAYDRAIEINPNYAEAWAGKCYSHNTLTRFSQALEACNEALEINPENAQAWTSQAFTFNATRQYNQAIVAANRAIRYQANNAQAYVNRGVAQRRLERYEDALESYNRAIEIEPNYAEAWHNRGYVLEELKRYEEALNSYEKAVELEPNLQQAIENRNYLRRILQ
ncbi:protein kinase domain-containing protein [Oscillatoria salina]|uniref:serine/threonine-protein kinase n=1 Tax=Oscillatoria salina TaxID=331517 RepID=UPI001CC9F6AD|nr:serine/threonine-protein kinase [Oscillatoria salina]MBZ8182512.1 tetratricopeptide repeat protein [Oscillatoria salina IIICB1]